MNPNELTVGPLYSKIESCTSKYIILQGGKWSSKTVNTLVRLGVLATQKKYTITVIGSTVPNLKKGALRDFKNHVACKDGIREYIKDFNSSDRIYTFKNGSIIEFTSYTNALEATSGKRDFAFFNEVNGIGYDIFYNVAISTNLQIFMDYNPTAPFYIHYKFINAKPGDQFYGKFTRFITDHRHNPFLSEEKHNEIESISDPERHRVYARGLTGKVEGLIYNMTKVDSIPEGLPFGFGIDIGYTTDKTAIVKVYFNKRDRYYQELLYKSENEILDEIVEKKLNCTVKDYMDKILKANGCTTSTLVWGDHDKNYSNGLRRLNIPYRMARKGPNSVVMGISKVKECNNYYYNSPNLESELTTYEWEKAINALTGEEITTNQPVDGMPDHILAAIRYFNFSFGMRFSETEE
jgi:phage terminase large subunit